MEDGGAWSVSSIAEKDLAGMFEVIKGIGEKLTAEKGNSGDGGNNTNPDDDGGGDNLYASPLRADFPGWKAMSKDERKEYLNRQSSSKNKTSPNNETDQNLPGTNVARRSESQSAERSARELAIDVFRGKGTEGRKYLADGSKSLVERIGEDWVGLGRDGRAVRHQEIIRNRNNQNILAIKFVR